MRVIFEDEKEKGKLLANARNLAEAEGNMKKLSVVHDMTQKERQDIKHKLSQVKEKNKETASGDYKFVLKGPPWDKRIVKEKKKKN